MMDEPVIVRTELPGCQPAFRGKVRDMYALGDRCLIVATDRLSAFDVVLPDGIPFKGKVLTQISAFWFERLAQVAPHHMVSTAAADVPEPFSSHPELFGGRSMLVRAAEPLPVECVARGYLSGSGWSEYRERGTVCGIRLPAGLKESDRLPEPIFTPSSKAERGRHDENITFDAVVGLVGGARAEQLRGTTLRLYREGAAFAEQRGIIIADTKFEFGIAPDGSLLWIDEALTPDSSRFWPKDLYAPGGPQPSFDKQFVRDHLLAVGWNKLPPGPHLPPDVIATTSTKYLEALRLLTGRDVAAG
jgi:phosphoribosylaminoimidazole-succinocarboxamide synthase